MVSIVAKSQTNDEQAFLNAVRSGDLNIVQDFLSRDNVNVNVRNDRGQAAIHLATFNRRVGVLIKLLADPRTDVNARSANGTTALYEAANLNDDAEATKVLLTHLKIDVNFQMHGDGWTALHRAAYWGRLEIVQVLSNDSRIDFYVKGRGGTAAAIAYREGNKEVRSFLLLKIGLPPDKDIWPVRCVRFLRSHLLLEDDKLIMILLTPHFIVITLHL